MMRLIPEGGRYVGTSRKMKPNRHVAFISFSMVLVAIYAHPLLDLVVFSRKGELYTHLPAIPLLSAYLIFLKRRQLSQIKIQAFLPGLFGLFLASCVAVVYWLQLRGGMAIRENNHLFISGLLLITSWISGGLIFYGVQCVKVAWFPLFFLIFMLPMPTIVLDFVVWVLQASSAEAAYALLTWTGTPVYRDGLAFHLPGLSVEVARECSGIHSTLVLFIISLLAGHLFLESSKARLILIATVYPIAVVRNGLRVVALCLVTMHIDPSTIHSGYLHKQGGVPFFIMSLVPFFLILWLLRKMESPRKPISPLRENRDRT